MEAVINDSYLQKLEDFSQKSSVDHLHINKKKSQSLKDLDNFIYTEINSPSNNLSNIFKRRYKSQEVNHLFNTLLEFPIKSGFDFFQKEIFIYNKEKEQKFTKIDVPYVSSNRLFEHFITRNYTYALKIHEHTTILPIDIDYRSQDYNLSIEGYQSMVNKVIQYLGSQPFLIEYSTKSKGYHIFFDFGIYLDKEKIKNLTTIIKQKFGLTVEIKTKNNILRLPLSDEYQDNAGLYNPNKPNLIEKQSTFQNIQNYVYRSSTLIPWKLHFISGNTLKHDRELFVKELTNTNKDFSYGKGTRWENQIKIGYHILQNNENATFEDFVHACEYWNDGTSKDMNLPSIKRDKLLQSMWTWINSNFKKINKPDKKSLLPSDSNCFPELIGADDDLKELSNKEYNNLKFHINKAFLRLKIGKPNSKFHKRFIYDCLNTIEFLVSMDKFRKKHKFLYKKKEFQFLNHGIPVGLKLQNTIANHYGIKNIRKIFKFLQKAGFISKIYNDKGYSHSYKNINYSTHYSINYKFLLYINSNKTNLVGKRWSFSSPSYIYNIDNFLFQSPVTVVGLNGIHLRDRLKRIKYLKEIGKIPEK